jgi:hypothetical protein
MFHRIEHVLRTTGDAVSGATVTVYLAGTTTKPTLYATNDTSQPIANPLTTDANGRYAYYIANGVYDETVQYGAITASESNIQMYDIATLAAPSWGGIGGLLANQADLVAALALKRDIAGLGPFATGTDAANLTGTIAAARLPVFDNANKGAVPASGGGTANFLRADGTWAAPPGGGGGSGALTSSGYTMSTGRLIGRSTAATGAPEELTPAAVKLMLGITAADVSGFAAIATSGSAADLTAGTIPVGRMPAHTGDVTSVAGGVALTIGANKVTRAMLAQATGATILGATGAGNIGDLTAAQAKTVLAITDSDVAKPVTTQAGTAYTAVAGDANSYIRFTNGGTITFTIPPNSSVAYAIGTEITFEQAGAGLLSVAAGAGVTINSRAGDLTLAGQYAVAAMKKVGTDTWTLTGDL